MSEKNDLPLNTSDPSKPHLSASSLGLFSRCPEAYRRRYIEGEKGKANMAMIKGKALHSAIQASMNAKAETGKDLPGKYLDDIVNDTMSDSLKDCDVEDDSGVEASDVRTQVTFHKVNLAPDYQPTETEIPFRIELDSCGHDYVGYIDMTGTLADTQKSVIVDWKTASRTPAKNSQHDSLQLTGYYASQVADLGTDVELRLDYIVSSYDKTNPKRLKGRKRHLLKTRRDADDVAALAQRINIASKVIEAEIFPPASVDSAWWCGASWCQYHSTCRFVNPERRAKELARERVEEAIRVIQINEKGNPDE